MTNKIKTIIKNALDLLAVALTSYNHVWTSEERRAYERAIKALE